MKKLLLLVLLLPVACKEKAPSLTGEFSVTQNGVTTTASLKVLDDQLTGMIDMGGSAGLVAGKVSGTTVQGTITSTAEKKNYSFNGMLIADTLKLIIRFPELNNQEITFNLKRITAGTVPAATAPASGSAAKADTLPHSSEVAVPAPETATSSESANPPATDNTQRDQRLIGTWKNTEVISSGSGDSYGSFSSESYIQFLEDGTVYTWLGKSAGSGGGQSFGNEGSSQKQKGKWRTEGKYIVLSDPASGQEGKTQFMVDANRMLLSDGGSNKKIFLRID